MLQVKRKLNIIASNHTIKDFIKFWKNTHKLNSKPNLLVSVTGVHDVTEIAKAFRSHFKVSSPLMPVQ